MAISFGAVGTYGEGTTSCTPTYPGSISSSTSELFAVLSGRSSVAGTAFTPPSGWTLVPNTEMEGGQAFSFATDSGTRRVAWFKKDTVTGSESGTVTFSFGAGDSTSTIAAHIVRIERASGKILSVLGASGADSSVGFDFSVSASPNIDWAANDFALVATCAETRGAGFASESLTAAGLTAGTLTNRVFQSVASGAAHKVIADSAPITAGSGAAAATTFSGTLGQEASGPSAILRLRETTAGGGGGASGNFLKMGCG